MDASVMSVIQRVTGQTEQAQGAPAPPRALVPVSATTVVEPGLSSAGRRTPNRPAGQRTPTPSAERRIPTAESDR
jgi:hypothetical protein